jgi:hypothetical protein
MTSEDVQRYVRIAIYWGAGFFAQRGMGIDGSYVDLIAAVAVTGANFAWSVWGMRINGKIAELSKYGEVKKIVANPIIANVDFADNAKVVAH